MGGSGRGDFLRKVLDQLCSGWGRCMGLVVCLGPAWIWALCRCVWCACDVDVHGVLSSCMEFMGDVWTEFMDVV